MTRSILAEQFEQVAVLMRTMDTDAIWNAASDRERKLLVNKIIEAVIVHPDRLQVTIKDAPPITVALRRGRAPGSATAAPRGGRYCL